MTEEMKKYVPCPSCYAINRVTTDLPRAKDAKCGKCHTLLQANDPVREVNAAALDKIILNSPVPVIVDFWAPWCGPCLSFAPTFQQFAQNNPSTAIYLKLNTEAHQEAGARMNIRSIPTLAIFKDEKEIARKSGALPYSGLKQWLGSNGVSAI